MSSELDFSTATLFSGPNVARDGGSIYIQIEIDGVIYNIRYAGSFGDVLNEQDGKIELNQSKRSNKDSKYFDISDLFGWENFINKNAEKLGNYTKYFLGKFQMPEAQRQVIIKTFGG